MVLGRLDPARLARSGLDRATSVVSTGVALPRRIVGLVGQAEELLGQARTALQSVDATIGDAAASVARVSRILDRAEASVARTDAVLSSTEPILAQTRGLLHNAEAVTADATRTLRTARTLTDDASGMLTQLQPALDRAMPLLEKFVTSLSPAEIDAAIKLVDELPVLTESVRADILPILRTLDRVGPDINELLHVMDDVRHAIIGIPGFAFFKKRGTDRIEDDDAFEPHPHDAGVREVGSGRERTSDEERPPGHQASDVGLRDGVDQAPSR
jgi:ABC-type transporter Mla subunit MlaD